MAVIEEDMARDGTSPFGRWFNRLNAVAAAKVTVAVDRLESSWSGTARVYAAVAALRAGCDLLLYCASLDRALCARDAIAAEAEREPSFAARLEQAVRRVEELATSWTARAPVPEDRCEAALAALREF